MPGLIAQLEFALRSLVGKPPIQGPVFQLGLVTAFFWWIVGPCLLVVSWVSVSPRAFPALALVRSIHTAFWLSTSWVTFQWIASF
jgi:hypothetical protein